MRGHVTDYRTKSGRRWKIVYDLPPDPETGKRRQTTRRGFETKREAQRALRDILSEVEDRTYVAPSKSTLAEYLRVWLDGIRVKPVTLAGYRRNLETYVIPRLGGVKLAALTPEQIDAMYRELERSGKRDGTGLAPKTVRGVHGTLRKALQDAMDRGHVGRNVCDLANPPTARQARGRRARDDIWTTTQLRTFLAQVEDDRLYAAWRLIGTTGLRRAEVLGLRWTDVDLDNGRLSIRQTVTVAGSKPIWQDTAKTPSGERTIAMDVNTVEVLRAHRKRQLEEKLAAGPGWEGDPHGPLVFTYEDGRAVRPQQFSRYFLRHVRELGMPEIGVHGLRHTYATAALRAGVSPEVVAERLGHSDIATTLSIYAHVLDSDDTRAAETVAAVIFGG